MVLFNISTSPDLVLCIHPEVGDYVLVKNDESTDNFLSYDVAKIER